MLAMSWPAHARRSPRPQRRGRIETRQSGQVRVRIGTGSPRPQRRGRIETLDDRNRRRLVPASVPPGLSAGGGLKQPCYAVAPSRSPRSPRPQRRGRIETSMLIACVQPSGSPRPQRRGRIETCGSRLVLDQSVHVPPGLSAGGGLKPRGCVAVLGLQQFPPASAPGAD